MAQKTLCLNLNEAFKLRNKMKAKIASLCAQIRSVNLYADPDLTEEEAVRALDGKPFDSVVVQAEQVMDALCRLNTAIDRANVENRTLLNELETLKVKESLNRSITDGIRHGSVFETRLNSVTGESTKVRLRPVFKSKDTYVEKEKEFSAAQRTLEEKVSLANGKTQFDYAIEESVYESIYS